MTSELQASPYVHRGEEMKKINKNQEEALTNMVYMSLIFTHLGSIGELVEELPDSFYGTKVAFENLIEVYKSDSDKNKGDYVNE